MNSADMRPIITVLGLGAGDAGQLPLNVYRRLRSASSLYLRTGEHPVVRELLDELPEYKTFDRIYEQTNLFEEAYGLMTKELLEASKAHGEICYAVPGHPLVAEMVVQQLLEAENAGKCRVDIIGGQSFLDPVFAALRLDPSEGFQLLDATALKREEVQVSTHLLLTQVYDRMTASEVKLTLMELYPEEHTVHMISGAGTGAERLQELPLYELDREEFVDNLMSVYVPPLPFSARFGDWDKLRSIIAALRAPDGCPWDRKQTHESLKRYLLEETYEVLSAIDAQDDDNLQEELGDILLQVMLHAQIGEEEGFFTIDDVVESVTEKLIRRHPHVFAESAAATPEEVNTQWEQIKQAEKGKDGEEDSLLADIPQAMPALMRAYEIQKKAAKAGFDWGDDAPMWDKLHEEIEEWKAELQAGNEQKSSKEFGDILFVLVNLARFFRVHPEEALEQTNQKFFHRFAYIERRMKEENRHWKEENFLQTAESWWQEAKKEEL
ncbi:nucleoside triphosphate pyrophosphohydrolase [Marinococcus sp. PL1-022]|uniref:nucleoside triphosphate pyrophosphohydrolase n=1 Tax=Marinococcus sp. PL1-022 TaxID=3095363 RepID=UPI0029C2C943|nr:nucleoside triphosphate pyrophosphohydrolase [Marinococcus sp. PL1-022]MDX6154442.1 nucleoside triphosphate pyrophosphohydrolase [Marinococcus sp. PL1-022]